MAVLIIDDEASIRKLFRAALERPGFRVHEASEGQAGLDVMRETPIDLVITDLLMAGQEGIETIQELRRSFPYVRILAVSGAMDGVYLRMARALGADEAIAKPVSLDQLVTKVGRLICPDWDDEEGDRRTF